MRHARHTCESCGDPLPPRNGVLPVNELGHLVECYGPCTECVKCTRAELLDETFDPGIHPRMRSRSRPGLLQETGNLFVHADYDPDVHGFFWDQ